jgi:hypothetical protein
MSWIIKQVRQHARCNIRKTVNNIFSSYKAGFTEYLYMSPRTSYTHNMARTTQAVPAKFCYEYLVKICFIFFHVVILPYISTEA